MILDTFISLDPNFREIVDNSCRQLVAGEEELLDALNITVPPAFLEQLRWECEQLNRLEEYCARTMARLKELQAPY